MKSTVRFLLEQGGFVLLALAVLVVASPLAAQGSAAEVGASGDIEQMLMERLAPDQLEAFLAGADPASIFLDDGRTLEEFLLEGLIDTASNSVYHPLNQCVVVKTATGAGKFAANEKRDYVVRGTCGVAADATAVVLNVKAYSAPSNGQVFVYPFGHTSTPAVVNIKPGLTINNMLTVAMGSAGDFSVKSSCPAHLVIHTVGYFAPLVGAVGPTGPPGADGVTGPTGPPGPNGIWSWQLSENISTPGIRTFEFCCPDGRTAISGICGQPELPKQGVHVIYSGLITTDTHEDQCWKCTVDHHGTAATVVRIGFGVYCVG